MSSINSGGLEPNAPARRGASVAVILRGSGAASRCRSLRRCAAHRGLHRGRVPVGGVGTTSTGAPLRTAFCLCSQWCHSRRLVANG